MRSLPKGHHPSAAGPVIEFASLGYRDFQSAVPAALFGEGIAFPQKCTMNLDAACADLYSIEEIFRVLGDQASRRASDHIPLARRCASWAHPDNRADVRPAPTGVF